jgi:hypothetical protein
MLEDKIDLFNPPKYIDAICITTNGITRYNGSLVMGKGVALGAKEKFLGIDERLGKLVKSGGNHVYLAWMWEHNGKPTFVLSFPTKNHWKDTSDLNLIIQSSGELVRVVDQLALDKVLLPRPGCANGGLSWEQVKSAIGPILDDRFVITH